MHTCSFWPEEVRQRISKTYTYFASGLGVTAIAAYAATRSSSMIRFMAGRPIAVSFKIQTVIVMLLTVFLVSYIN